MELLARTGVGRDINRRRYTQEEILSDLERPVVRKLLELVRFRNEHPAFAGEFAMPGAKAGELILEWRREADWARLEIDLAAAAARLSFSSPRGSESEVIR